MTSLAAAWRSPAGQFVRIGVGYRARQVLAAVVLVAAGVAVGLLWSVEDLLRRST